jgi:enoyl-CoA hydratase
MSFRHILFERDAEGVVTLTLNRPAKRNALSGELLDELDQALAGFESDPAQRALLVTGAGEKAFAAGVDIGELTAQTAAVAERYALRGQRIFGRLEAAGKPSIAVIRGYALGGGLELAMACTLRVAGPEAKLGLPEVRLGTIPGFGGTQRLPRLVGRGRALEMLLTGDMVDAAEAHRIGLVDHVVEPERLMEFARSLAARILAVGPLAAAWAMRAVDVGLNAGLEQGLRCEAAAFGLTAATGDRREGLRAFLEKRTPVFTGE